MKDLQASILCDVCGVTGAFLHVGLDDPSALRAGIHLRQKLMAEGWKYNDADGDLCPACQAKAAQ